MGRQLTTRDSARYILVVDDDPMCQPLLEQTVGLKAVSYASLAALQASERGLRPVAIFLDVDLNGETTLPHLPLIREAFPYIPIIVMSVGVEAQLLVKALSLGADDFIRKPFDRDEVRARLECRLLNRQTLRDAQRQTYHDLHLDKRAGRVCGPDVCAFVSGRESELLGVLMDARGVCVSRDRLLATAWGGTKVSQNSLDKRIQMLRRTLREIQAGVEIVSEYGTGYRLVAGQ